MHELTGLLRKYPVNRRLSYEEKEGAVGHAVPHEVEPTCSHAVINVNGTYMELAGKFYEWRGVFGTGMAIVMLFSVYGLFFSLVLLHSMMTSINERYLWPRLCENALRSMM